MAKLNSGTRIYGNLTIDTWANITGTTTSISTTTGALVVAGGAGIAGNIVTAGTANKFTGCVAIGSTDPTLKFQISADGYNTRISDSTNVYGYNIGRSTTDGLLYFYGDQTVYTGYVFSGVDGERVKISSAGNLVINATTTSTTTTGGALVVKGGAGVAGTMTVGGTITGKTNTGGNVAASNDTGTLSIRGDNTNAAIISFHRPSAYAINMGLDTDNTFKIGGWSDGASTYRLQVTSAGALTLIGGITATSATLTGTLIATTVNAGTIGNSGATLTGTISTAAQTNITSVGTLTSLAVGAVTSSGTIIASTINAGTFGNASATHVGASATLTGTLIATTVNAGTIGNSGATLTGTLNTAAQTGITSVGTLGTLTITGNTSIGTSADLTKANLYVFGGNLGATVGSQLQIASFAATNTNGSYLRFFVNRWAQGADWLTASTKIQQRIDVTDQGYIEFNPQGGGYGVDIGNGTTPYLRIFTGGNIVIPATTTSTTATTGALVIPTGGLGVGGISYFGANVTHAGNILPSANISYNLGSTVSWWNNFYGKAIQAQYADLAEHYTADDLYGPGTVVVFGGQQEITTTDISHDTRVAGVISANPAYLMNAANPGLPVALTGRVPCLVQGPVFKGQVLVTSTTVGTAQGIDNTKYVPGCVIGKALATINSNTIETIEVVVGRF